MRPAPLIRGEDLIAAGYTPGPRFKPDSVRVEDGQLEGRLSSKEDAMELWDAEFPLAGIGLGIRRNPVAGRSAAAGRASGPSCLSPALASVF